MSIPKHTAVWIDDGSIPARRGFVASTDMIDATVPDGWAVVAFFHRSALRPPEKPPRIEFELVRESNLCIRGC